MNFEVLMYNLGELGMCKKKRTGNEKSHFCTSRIHERTKNSTCLMIRPILDQDTLEQGLLN